MAKLTKKEQQQYDKCLGQCTQCMLSGNCKLRLKIRELRVLSDTEKLWIALSIMNEQMVDEYAAECERREKENK